ncbi:MAG: glycerol-3-phosphate acyltransferase [Candidatus Thorarchaeota archaeon]
MIEIIINILSIMIGYLIGSISPAYIFGKLKHIDIRTKGSGNAGTTNAFHTLGASYAVPTAIIDTLKGVLSIFIAQIIGANFFCAQFSGLAAVIGHVFPFYMHFRGGRGVACATGILLYYLLQYIFISIDILYILLFLCTLIIIFAYISKNGKIIRVIILPLLGYSAFLLYSHNLYAYFFYIIITYITLAGIFGIITDKVIKVQDERFNNHWWRVALRPFAFIFIILYLIYSKILALTIISIVFISFFGLDIFRFLNKQRNNLLMLKVKSLFRRSEAKKLSSMTLFLLAAFITIILFNKNIAILALTFLIFGDIFSKIFGLAFGRNKLFNKTFEGTLAYIGSVLICGFLFFLTLHFSLIILIIGGIAAPLTELVSYKINDNFTVPLVSGALMTLGIIFIG